MLRNLLLSSSLLIALCACQQESAYAASSAADHTPGGVASTQAVLQKMAPSSKVACKDDGHGQAECTADGVAVSVAGCGKGALYGAISAKGGVDLTDAIDGRGTASAHVSDGQFVCVAAIQQASDTQRYYVIAVPTASVPECKGNELCKGADRPVQFKKATTGTSCHAAGNGDYTGDCAAGWVEEGHLDQYANGI